MKKLIIVLLVVMLGLGLSGIASAVTTGSDTQTIDATISSALELTVPVAISSWDLSTIGLNSQPNQNITVCSNRPYHIEIKADDTSAYGAGSSGHMNKWATSVYTTADTDVSKDFLDTELIFDYTDTSGATDTSNAGTNVSLTSANQTVVYITDNTTDDDGFITQINFDQTIGYDDPVFVSGSSLTWHIVITYTATQDLS